MVQLLLDRGAQINAKDHFDRTPLDWATSKGHELLGSFLLGRGCPSQLQQHVKQRTVEFSRSSDAPTDDEDVVPVLGQVFSFTKSLWQSASALLKMAARFEHSVRFVSCLNPDPGTEALLSLGQI